MRLAAHDPFIFCYEADPLSFFAYRRFGNSRSDVYNRPEANGWRVFGELWTIGCDMYRLDVAQRMEL